MDGGRVSPDWRSSAASTVRASSAAAEGDVVPAAVGDTGAGTARGGGGFDGGAASSSSLLCLSDSSSSSAVASASSPPASRVPSSSTSSSPSSSSAASAASAASVASVASVAPSLRSGAGEELAGDLRSSSSSPPRGLSRWREAWLMAARLMRGAWKASNTAGCPPSSPPSPPSPPASSLRSFNSPAPPSALDDGDVAASSRAVGVGDGVWPLSSPSPSLSPCPSTTASGDCPARSEAWALRASASCVMRGTMRIMVRTGCSPATSSERRTERGMGWEPGPCWRRRRATGRGKACMRQSEWKEGWGRRRRRWRWGPSRGQRL